MTKLHVLCGLPGSGKTTFAKSKENKTTFVHDVDTYLMSKKDKKKALKDLLVQIKQNRGKYNEHMLDGLFLVHEVYEYIVHLFNDWEVVFHVWKEDRETCLWNDRYRREKNADITIRHATFELPDVEKLRKENEHVSVFYYDIQRKSAYQLFKDKYQVEDTLKSDYWVISSRERRYTEDWDDYWVDGYCEPKLEEFKEFDELLEKIAPTIGFLQYKKLYNQTVIEDEYHEHDYYDAYTKGIYLCDIQKLYDLLIEMGIIDIEKI